MQNHSSQFPDDEQEEVIKTSSKNTAKFFLTKF